MLIHCSGWLLLITTGLLILLFPDRFLILFVIVDDCPKNDRDNKTTVLPMVIAAHPTIVAWIDNNRSLIVLTYNNQPYNCCLSITITSITPLIISWGYHGGPTRAPWLAWVPQGLDQHGVGGFVGDEAPAPQIRPPSTRRCQGMAWMVVPGMLARQEMFFSKA